MPAGEKWLGYFWSVSSLTSFAWLLSQPIGQWSHECEPQPDPPVSLKECSFSRVKSWRKPPASPSTQKGGPSRRGLIITAPRESSSACQRLPQRRAVDLKSAPGSRFQKTS